jgi:hypothetical protein
VNATQVLTVLVDHHPTTGPAGACCACDAGVTMTALGHLHHVAEQVARASQLGAPSGPDRWVLRAHEITADHVGLTVTVPVPGLGDVVGRLIDVGVWDATHTRMVEVTVYDLLRERERALVVTPNTWVSLTPA